jgi:hypothetical protein
MLAADLTGSKVIVALDQPLFRKEHMKPHDSTLGAFSNPCGHGTPPLIVIVTVPGAGEPFMGQDALVGQTGSGGARA